MQPKRLTISSPERIHRILHRICQSRLVVMLRTASDSKVLVKGRVAAVIQEGDLSGIRIGSISAKGHAHLMSASRVQVEFSMMSAKIVFLSHVIVRERSSIVLSIPAKLVNIERRENMRYATTDDLVGLLVPSMAPYDGSDPATAPAFEPYFQLGGFQRIVDISMGGFCTSTRYPKATEWVRGTYDSRAKVYLPMRSPFVQPMVVRWIKTVIEPGGHEKGQPTAPCKTYRIGYAFESVSDEAKTAVASFIRQLMQAGAI